MKRLRHNQFIQIPSYEKFQENDEFQSVRSYYSSSAEDDDVEEEKNSKKSPFSGDQEFSAVLQDGESVVESSKHCRRSKRVRKSSIFYSVGDGFETNEFSRVKKSEFGEANEHSPVSSISDTTPEEDVAYCLMMLSRDKWRRENDCCEDSGFAKVIKTKVRGKYRCETCSKLFRSYQALGGHRASHKKCKVNEAPAPPLGGGGTAAVVVEKVHECPFCQRVFSSGQALGGHKRSHFIGAAAISGNVSTDKEYSRNGEMLKIDLNLPAPIDDHDISL